MNKILRKVSVVVGILILFFGLRYASSLGNPAPKPDKGGKPDSTGGVPQNYVQSMKVNNETLASEVIISGKVIARQKIDLFSEVTGTLNKVGKEFREGVQFGAGELMLVLDDTEAQLELQAAKSQLYSSLVALLPDLENDYKDNFNAWKNYIDAFDINKPVQDLPATKSSREKLFIGAKNIGNQHINIKRQEFRLTKYKIYAPFDGILSNAMVYEGALVRSGQKLGELTQPSRYELEATISLYDVEFFKMGNSVKLYSDATKEQWVGTIARFGKTIDEKTQTQKVFITINSNKLNEGMFLNGKVMTKALPDVVQLPRKLLVGNNGVYIIKDKQLALQTVEVLKVDNNLMYVKGLSDGMEVLAQVVLGAYEGMPISIIEN